GIRRNLTFCKLLKRRRSNNTSPTDAQLSFLRNPVRWYEHKLDTYPLVTKCVTSGIISGSGDLLCQYLTNSHNDARNYDWTRSLRFAILGSVLVAPSVHVWYGFLMTRIPEQSIKAIATRLFCDQGLFAPLFLPTFVSCLTVLEHVSDGINKNSLQLADDSTDFSSHLKTRLHEIPESVVVGWKIWVPSMTVMFAFVPNKYQVLYSNCVGFIWNAYLSWKTHEGEGASRKR
ncbi:hypothetical protein ACHAWX_000870, partial [Stephanocyclus meneghinianus]